MTRILKLLIVTTLMFCFTYSGKVWTKPASKEQIDPANPSLVSTTLASYSAQSAVPYNWGLSGRQSVSESQSQAGTKTEPALIFLFGIGLIGFFAMARRIIMVDKRKAFLTRKKSEGPIVGKHGMKPYLRITISP